MRFTELVLQGVRRFGQTHRFPLGDGLTVFVGGAGAGKTSFVDVIVHLLFPDTSEPATTAFQAQGSDVCRVALTLDDGRGQVYRLVKDLLRGSLALTRFDTGSQQFAPVSSSPAEILQYLSSTLHLPQRDLFEGLYVLRAGDLPSAAPAPAAGPGAAPAGGPPGALTGGSPPAGLQTAPGGGAGGFPGYQGDAGGGGGHFPGYQGGGFDDGGEVLPDDPQQLRSQIDVLERDLSAARMVDDLQFKLDGLQSEMFELEDKSKGVRQAQQRLEELRRKQDQFSDLAELPGDFEERVKSYKQDGERHARDLARLDEERERWEKQAEGSLPAPLLRNRNFQLGLAGGLVALLAGTAGFFTIESLRWIALLSIPAFGVVVIAAMRHIDQIMSAERAETRLGLLDERRKKLERQFELESSIVKRTMEQVGADSPERVIEMYAKRNELLAAIQQAEQDVAKQQAQVGQANLEQRKAELQSEIDGIESELASMSGLMMSPSEMERKLGLMRDKLDWLESGGAAGGAAGAAAAPLGGGAPPGAMGSGDPAAALGVGAPPGAMGGGDPAAALGVGAPPGAMGGGGAAGGLGPAGPEPLQAGPAGGGGAGPEVCRRLLKLAEDLFLTDLERLAPAVCPRASQFMAALSTNAYTELKFDARAELELVEAASGVPSPLAALPAEQQDRVFLALWLTVIEAFSKKTPVPVLLDDPVAALPPELHPLTGRMLAGIGRGTQVVLLTAHSELAQHGAAAYSL
jgi:hypothetical protein